MRNDYPTTGQDALIAKSSTAHGQTISKKEQTEAHQAAFGTLLEDVAKDVGLPGDEVLYHDPMGFLTGGEPVDLISKMFEGVGGADGWSAAFDVFNQEVRKGASIYEASQEVKKALGRSSFSMPIFVAPDVRITDQRNTPIADMVARLAIDVDTYKVDEQTDHGDSARFYEPGTNSGTDETWASNDDTYSTHTYNVLPYGRQTAVTDFLQLAANSLRSSRAITEEALMRSQRFYEENQIIQGNGTHGSLSGNDANGWAGLPDLLRNESNQSTDESTAKISEAKVRKAIEELRRDGAAYDDIVHVTDHKTFNDLKQDVDDFVRYQSPGDTLNFGFRALNVEGTPVMESHGAPNSDGSRVFASFDASTVRMAMLQDATMHPLARTSPEEDVAVDSYGVFASDSTERIRYRYNLA